MKKAIFALFALVLVSLCVLVPVSASSGNAPYSGLVLNVPVANHDPDYLVFDDRDVGASGLYVEYSDVYKWSRVYRYDQDRILDTSVCFIVFAFDSEFNALDVTSFNLEYFISGVYQARQGISGNVFYIDISVMSRYGHYSIIDLSAGTHVVKYACIVPMPDYADSTLFDDYYDFYTTSFSNYFAGIDAYLSGYSAGASADYWAGVQVGMQQSNQSAWNDGYDSGKQDGLAEGRGQGYEEGKRDGIGESQSELSAYSNAVMDTVSAPFLAISNFLNFEVLGINLAGLFAFIVTALIIAFIIKKLM